MDAAVVLLGQLEVVLALALERLALARPVSVQTHSDRHVGVTLQLGRAQPVITLAHPGRVRARVVVQLNRMLPALTVTEAFTQRVDDALARPALAAEPVLRLVRLAVAILGDLVGLDPADPGPILALVVLCGLRV